MEDNTVTDSVITLEEPEITSIAERGCERIEQTSTDSNGKGHGSEASSLWSLTYDDQVKNLKRSLKRAFSYANEDVTYENKSQPNPWFNTVVKKLRDDPNTNSCDLEMEISLPDRDDRQKRKLKMTSLGIAILMGDLKMVKKILESNHALDDKVIFEVLEDPEDPLQSIILFTPLHLAVIAGVTNIVDVLLEKDVDVNIQNGRSPTPIELACKMGRVRMLRSLLAKDKEQKKLIDVALQCGDTDLIKKVLSKNSKEKEPSNRTALHFLAAYPHHQYDVTSIIVKCLVQDIGLDVKARDITKLSPFYVAVLCCNTPFVIVFLELYKDQIRLNEACDANFGPPIQIAFERGNDYKDIERALMECDPVKGYMDKLFRDRQVCVDAANAILVGAALIASVTFASWLQPPLNYTSYSGEGYSSSIPTPSTSDLNYADVEHNIPLRAFWVFNALSFYFAIATVVCGARAVLPRSHLFIEKIVKRLHTNLLVTSIFLACSVLFVIIAFAIAGTIVLTPLLKYQWCMIIPTVIGGVVCIISLGFLAKSMKEIYFNTSESIDVLNSKGKGYLEEKGYIMHKSISRSRGLE